MLDDFRIEAAWKYSMYNITQREALFLPFSPRRFPPCPFFLSARLLVCLRLFIRRHVCTLTSLLDELRQGKKKNRCLEGSFVALSHLSEAQPPSQHPQAMSEKMETAFCLE